MIDDDDTRPRAVRQKGDSRVTGSVEIIIPCCLRDAFYGVPPARRR